MGETKHMRYLTGVFAFLLVAMVLLLAAAGTKALAATIDVHLGFTSPGGEYRWLNVADQVYAESYRLSYQYSQAIVQVTYEDAGIPLSGVLAADNLKPNFAYQLKLSGTSGTAANERIGLAGRWWEETWDGSAWTGGCNLNNKGDGTPPNPNDVTYFGRRDIPEPTSPTGKLYRYTGYLLMDYFVTDDYGAALLNFRTDSSYHVLWKTSQRSRSSDDGPLVTVGFDPVTSAVAYDVDHDPATVGIFGEWERLPVGGVYLQPGQYDCRMFLTEESFHGSGGTFAGGWAAALAADIQFDIVAEPGDANGDMKVDGVDLAKWQQNYDPLGLNENTFDMGDWNCDGLIDGVDLALWQSNYDPIGPTGSSAAVPEPGTLLLIASGVIFLAAKSRLVLRNC